MCNISNKRGKDTAENEEPRTKKNEISQLVIDHIQKFHPCVSHYRGPHAPNRLSCSKSPEFMTKSIYQDFCTEHPDDTISYVCY